MKSVAAAEALEHFSELLAEAEAGEEIAITKDGLPVATLLPYRPKPRPMTPERQAAFDRLMARLEEGVPLGGLQATRDEMHER